MGRSGAAAFTLSCSILACNVATLASAAGQLGALRFYLRLNLFLVELRQWLALFDDIVDVDVEFFDDSRGLALDLDFGDGLDLAGCHDRPRHIAASHLGQFVGVDGCALHQLCESDGRQSEARRPRPCSTRSRIFLLFRDAATKPPVDR